jgi:ABC-type Fe3+-hydroxamate transport system substrate-binding protein
MSISRRHFGTGLVALGALAATRPALAQSTVHSITSSAGTYDVPNEPQRVVVIDFRLDLEPALALGLPVVGYGVQEEIPAWIPAPAGLTYVGGPPSRETVLGLNPDLIVCTDIPDSEYWPINLMAEIAPVIPVDYEMTWQDNLTRMGDWLDKADVAAAFLADYDSQLEAVKVARSAAIAGSKVAAVWFEPESNEIQVLLGAGTTNVTLAGQVLADLGGSTTDPAALGEYGVISMENAATVLADIDGFILDNTEPDRAAQLEAHPVWQRLPAVLAGKVHRSEGTFYGGGYSAKRLIGEWDQLFALLA